MKEDNRLKCSTQTRYIGRNVEFSSVVEMKLCWSPFRDVKEKYLEPDTKSFSRSHLNL